MKNSNEADNGISVIMPVHNGGIFLQPSVESILSQSHNNIELIIIDDYSTDYSISNLDKSDSRMKIIKSRGKGIVPALNTGIKQASKTFIARMDADDIALPRRLELQFNYLLANCDIEICGTQVHLFREDENLGGGYQFYQNWINNLTQADDIAKNIFIESPIPHPSAMMRKQHWLELNGYQDTDWPEDYDLWLRAHSKGFLFGKPEGILLHWRDHDSRLSRLSSRYHKKSFFKAKGFYLTKFYSNKRFRIWGSGPTGALLHDELVKNNAIVSDFIDVAAKRIGNKKRNKPIVDAYKLEKTDDLILVAVSARGARDDIREYLDKYNYIEGKDYICVA